MTASRRVQFMAPFALLLPLLFLGAAPATDSAAPTRSTFRYVDLYVDSHATPMGAYQLELTSRTGTMSVVGIEGGEHPAFASPPFHDRIEIIRNRVILAAYSTAEALPQGRTRVARVMVEIRGDQDPQYAARLMTAGSAKGEPIAADVSVAEGAAQ